MANEVYFSEENYRNDFTKYYFQPLINLINAQNCVANLTYDSNTGVLSYDYIYGLGRKSEKTITVPEELRENKKMYEQIRAILTRYEIVKYKTEENIQKNNIEEFISLLVRGRKRPDIPEEIDKYQLLQILLHKKEEIIAYTDSETTTIKTILAIIEDLIIASIALPINKEIGVGVLVYGAVSILPYAILPSQLDKMSNKRKYKSVLADLTDVKRKLKPNLSFLCIIQEEIYKLEQNPKIDYSKEIAELRQLAESYYAYEETQQPRINIAYVDKLVAIISSAESKERDSKTILFEDYIRKSNTASIKRYC